MIYRNDRKAPDQGNQLFNDRYNNPSEETQGDEKFES